MHARSARPGRRTLHAVLTPGNRATSFNGYTLTYDNAGNLTHKSRAGFDQYYYWNSIGQLDSVLTNGSAVHFGYDGQGRRVRKATTAHTLRYIYSGSQLVAEVDTGSLTAQKIYRYYPGVDRPMSVKQPAGTYYYLSGIGTPGVTGLIDSTGVIRNRYRYSPWGTLEDSLEQVPNVLKFAGREFDPETNLYYNRARYYDPDLARFLSEDPIGQSGGVNQYAYAGNNPIGLVDPSGRCGEDSNNPFDDYGEWGDCSPRTDGGSGSAGSAGSLPDCSDRGPVSINGGMPDMGYSYCGGFPDVGSPESLSSGFAADTSQTSDSTHTPPPWQFLNSSQCTVYPSGGVLYFVCSRAGNSQTAESMRGCLQAFYVPGRGYVYIPIPAPEVSDPNAYLDNEFGAFLEIHVACLVGAVQHH